MAGETSSVIKEEMESFGEVDNMDLEVDPEDLAHATRIKKEEEA